MRLSVDEIVAIHDRLIDQIGGSGGIRDRRLLESAVEAPFASFDEQHFYPTVTAQSARLGFGLIANHPFIDGNKRVGVVSMIVMLRGNGIEFAPNQRRPCGSRLRDCPASLDCR